MPLSQNIPSESKGKGIKRSVTMKKGVKIILLGTALPRITHRSAMI